jgi:hypothetical protein
MPIEIACPRCQRVLLVQDEHIGGQVRCPACGQISVVPRPGELGPGRRPHRRRRRARDRDPIRTHLMPPAICLIVLGGLVALLYGLQLLLMIAGKEPFPPPRGMVDRLGQSMVRAGMWCGTCSPLMGSAVIIVGGVKMLQREHYRVAMTAAIVAMIPCTAGLGCFLGLPLGIWSIIVLRRDDVASAFRGEFEEEKIETHWTEEE